MVWGMTDTTMDTTQHRKCLGASQRRRHVVARMGTRSFWAIVAAVWLAAGEPAHAQLQLPDLSAYRGIKAGRFKIWPRFDVEGGYDSNVFYQSSSDPTPITTAGLLRVGPGVRVENPTYGDLHLVFDGVAKYRRFFSGNDQVDSQQSNIQADVDFVLGLFERRIVAARVFDHFQRRLDTPNESIDATYNRFINRAGLRVGFRPGFLPGRTSRRPAFEIGLQYAFDLIRFDDFSEFDQNQHEARLLGQWRFFPKTALEFSATWALRDWRQASRDGSRHDSRPLRVLIGLNGFITRHIAATVRVGYGQGFYTEGPDVHAPIGRLSVSWTPRDQTVVTGGYMRDFTDSYYSNYFTADRVFAEAQQQLGHHFDVRAHVEYDYLHFASFDPSAVGADVLGRFRVTNQTTRREHAIVARLDAEWDVTRFLGLTLGYHFERRFSDFREYVSADATLSDDDTLIDAGGFVRHELVAGLRAQY